MNEDWLNLREQLVGQCESIAKGCEDFTIIENIQKIAKEMIIIGNCESDCECSICHELKRNSWDDNYPNVNPIINHAKRWLDLAAKIDKNPNLPNGASSYICPHCSFKNTENKVCNCVSCQCGRIEADFCDGCGDGDVSCKAHCICDGSDFIEELKQRQNNDWKNGDARKYNKRGVDE